mmetsp:Transcript_39146/g.98407  ORF Transcript_39146/g.98407 Transcript_39146/m.98407 type:complete len:209 (-) Transcript_39146:1653-2279(-)
MELVHIDGEGHGAAFFISGCPLQDVEEQERQSLWTTYHLLPHGLHGSKQQSFREEEGCGSGGVLLDAASKAPEASDVKLVGADECKIGSGDIVTPSCEALQGSTVDNMHGARKVTWCVVIRVRLAPACWAWGAPRLRDHRWPELLPSFQGPGRLLLNLHLPLEDRRLRGDVRREPPCGLVVRAETGGEELQPVSATQLPLPRPDLNAA